MPLEDEQEFTNGGCEDNTTVIKHLTGYMANHIDMDYKTGYDLGGAIDDKWSKGTQIYDRLKHGKYFEPKTYSVEEYLEAKRKMANNVSVKVKYERTEFNGTVSYQGKVHDFGLVLDDAWYEPPMLVKDNTRVGMIVMV
jgi:hypothetical protein